MTRPPIATNAEGAKNKMKQQENNVVETPAESQGNAELTGKDCPTICPTWRGGIPMGTPFDGPEWDGWIIYAEGQRAFRSSREFRAKIMYYGPNKKPSLRLTSRFECVTISAKSIDDARVAAEALLKMTGRAWREESEL